MGCVWLVAVMQCEPLPCQQEYGPWTSEGTAPLSETSLLVTGCSSAAWERPEVPRERVASQETTGYMVWKGEQEISE